METVTDGDIGYRLSGMINSPVLNEALRRLPENPKTLRCGSLFISSLLPVLSLEILQLLTLASSGQIVGLPGLELHLVPTELCREKINGCYTLAESKHLIFE